MPSDQPQTTLPIVYGERIPLDFEKTARTVFGLVEGWRKSGQSEMAIESIRLALCEASSLGARKVFGDD